MCCCNPPLCSLLQCPTFQPTSFTCDAVHCQHSCNAPSLGTKWQFIFNTTIQNYYRCVRAFYYDVQQQSSTQERHCYNSSTPTTLGLFHTHTQPHTRCIRASSTPHGRCISAEVCCHHRQRKHHHIKWQAVAVRAAANIGNYAAATNTHGQAAIRCARCIVVEYKLCCGTSCRR